VVAVAVIVEGHGEREAIPILVRRVAHAIDPQLVLDIQHPMRIPKSRMLSGDHYERALAMATARTGRRGVVLTILDADEDCAAVLGPALLHRGQEAVGDTLTLVVVVPREIEAWFLAAAASLRGRSGLPNALNPPEHPEAIRDAKGWLADQMGGAYSSTVDQPSLMSQFDLDEAERLSPSFARCRARLAELLRRAARQGSASSEADGAD